MSTRPPFTWGELFGGLALIVLAALVIGLVLLIATPPPTLPAF